MHEVFPVNFRGSGLVMAPLTFPRCRLWLAWSLWEVSVFLVPAAETSSTSLLTPPCASQP